MAPPAPDDPRHRSAAEQAALVRSGELSAVELAGVALAAAERDERGLNAFVTLAPERALAEAAEIGAGDPRPLAGVPIAIKDVLALTEGIRTTFGMRAMEDWVPRSDSALVRRLRGAGAIVIGKTSTPELGILPVTEPERFGPARNPWDPARTPGGSSGGSAAAVAAGAVALAHGNDGGGSIRIPASCCGLVGLKPSRGRVSLAPAVEGPLAHVAEGVLTRTVADTALALDVLAGPEPGDPWPLPAPDTPFATAATRDPERLRVGFTTAAPNGVPVHRDCVSAVEDTARLLAELGHEVEEGEPRARASESARHFIRLWTAAVGPEVANCSALRGRPIAPEELEPLTREMVAAGERIGSAELLASVAFLRAEARRLMAWWADHDVLLTPALARPPLEIGALDPPAGAPALDVLERASAFTPFTPPWNVTGQPAVSVPLWRSPAGLPIGVQLVGPPAGEALLLSLAGQLERARPWPLVAPPVPAGASARPAPPAPVSPGTRPAWP